MDNLERGFLFLAWGQKYISEAVVASRQLRKYNNEPICLLTAEEPAPSVLSNFDILIIKELKGDYSDKVFIKHSPFKFTIFLDTDILCCRPLTDLFDVLDNFDVALSFTEGGNHYSIPGVPSLFHEPSAGLIAWKHSNSIDNFFDLWEEWYEIISRQMGIWGAWDQRSLRAALFFSNVRICPIPDRFQFYTYRPNIVEGEIAAIHGRNISTSLVNSVNSSRYLRVWIPRVGFCPAPAHATFYELIIFAARLMYRALQLLLRRILALSGVYKYPAERRPG